MLVLPVHAISFFSHHPDKFLPAGGGFLTVQDCQGNVLDIAFYFPLLRLLQKLVRLFLPCHCFLTLRSLKGLALFWNVQSLFPTLCVAPLLQLLQVGAAPLQLVSILIIYRIDNKVCMDMVFILMGSYKNFKSIPCWGIFSKLQSVLMSLLR